MLRIFHKSCGALLPKSAFLATAWTWGGGAKLLGCGVGRGNWGEWGRGILAQIKSAIRWEWLPVYSLNSN